MIEFRMIDFYPHEPCSPNAGLCTCIRLWWEFWSWIAHQDRFMGKAETKDIADAIARSGKIGPENSSGMNNYHWSYYSQSSQTNSITKYHPTAPIKIVVSTAQSEYMAGQTFVVEIEAANESRHDIKFEIKLKMVGRKRKFTWKTNASVFNRLIRFFSEILPMVRVVKPCTNTTCRCN